MADSFLIQSGERFACMVFSGFDLVFNRIPLPMALSRGCWASSGLPFSLDGWWRDQLGKIVTERLEKYPSLVLTSKALHPDEDERLPLRRVEWLLWGIAISAGIPTFEMARAISGRIGESDIPRILVNTLPPLLRSYGLERSTAGPDDFMLASRFAERVEEMYAHKRERPRLYWRMLSGFTAFRLGAFTPEAELRLHQFVRVIESFLPPGAFGEKRFAECAQNFLVRTDDSEELLREMYRLRNKAEHHEHFEEAQLSGSVPKKLRTAGLAKPRSFCRELFRRLFAGGADFLDWYQDSTSIERFWADPAFVQDVWGTPFDLYSIR